MRVTSILSSPHLTTVNGPRRTSSCLVCRNTPPWPVAWFGFARWGPHYDLVDPHYNLQHSTPRPRRPRSSPHWRLSSESEQAAAKPVVRRALARRSWRQGHIGGRRGAGAVLECAERIRTRFQSLPVPFLGLSAGAVFPLAAFVLLATILPHLTCSSAHTRFALAQLGRVVGRALKRTACKPWSIQPPPSVVIGHAMIVVNRAI